MERMEGSPLPLEYDKLGAQSKLVFDKYPDLRDKTGKTTYLYIITKKVDTEENATITEKLLTKIETVARKTATGISRLQGRNNPTDGRVRVYVRWG